MAPWKNIPKGFLTAIRVPYGPFEGQLAQQCFCGFEISLDDDEVYLVEWIDGRLMFCHPECVERNNDAEI